MDGIEIPREVAESVDLPADLDSGEVGPYRFPDPRRRRISAVVFLVTAVLMWLILPPGVGRFAAVVLALGLATWNAAAAWEVKVDQVQALSLAAPAAPFPIGQISAALTFHGLRARPRWHVLMYESSDPPHQRALVVVDAVTGERMGEPLVELLSLAVGQD
jgi:hypothetical protein